MSTTAMEELRKKYEVVIGLEVHVTQWKNVFC